MALDQSALLGLLRDLQSSDPQTISASVTAAPDRYRAGTEAGLTDMPYPPEYPKMPGDPPRVQPSRQTKPDDADPTPPTS